MIVVDASAMVEALIGKDPDDGLLEALEGDLAAPHVLDVEVLSAIRILTLGRKLNASSAHQAISDHFAFSILRQEIEPLAERIWDLRHQFTSYDASYIALAEGLRAPLVTCDAKLATNGHSADVTVFPRSD
ncbi:type II toxin-antitoxin system VapC family toxin [Microlunatus soli]|uniref:Ribonuclease VapC n=1 Tax=Microlunatus soli TaxID=630515 RepID=A0A1H1ZJX2_9ACTN|nr:type II toxin-antitoxin system VapC family toxin [Microlunatus soli]SDT33953.1 Predicted nucleic acid-binding protein, contains PIN domain [Microlunatus soli]